MAKKDETPADLINPPDPKVVKVEPPTHLVTPEIDYDKLAEKMVPKFGDMIKSLSDPISEMLGIIKPKPLETPAPPAPPAAPETKKSAFLIPWFK